MDHKKVQFVICPGRYPSPQHASLYKKIYDCWHDVWSHAFKELHGDADLKSDNFTRQDFVCAVMVDGECKAMSLYRHMDAKDKTLERDSYFSNWSEIHRAKLSSQGPKILVCSHFTIHSSARKDLMGFSMRDVLMGSCSEVAIHTSADAMTGAMRKDRKVHDLALNWGALLVARDVPSGHGDLVDLVAFFKDEVKSRRQHEYVPFVQRLWEEKLVIPQELPEQLDAGADIDKIWKAG
jgi:hypothetical protein